MRLCSLLKFEKNWEVRIWEVTRMRACGARAAGRGPTTKLRKPSKNADQPAPLWGLVRVHVRRPMLVKNPSLLQQRCWSDYSDCVVWSESSRGGGDRSFCRFCLGLAAQWLIFKRVLQSNSVSESLIKFMIMQLHVQLNQHHCKQKTSCCLSGNHWNWEQNTCITKWMYTSADCSRLWKSPTIKTIIEDIKEVP